MAKKYDYKGNISYSNQPIAGVTLFQERKSTEPTLEELLDRLDRTDIKEKQKEELLAKLDERISKIRGNKEMAPAGRNLKRYLVDPETGRIDIDEEEGDYTYKDALLLSASVKGKGGQFEEAINLIKTVTALSEGKKQTEEKPKEFYVDPATAVIIHDPDNGECTLSEARAISQSMRGPTEDKQKTIQFLDGEGKLIEAPAGQPIIITKKEQAQPTKTYFLNENQELVEQEAGKPIVIKVQGPSGSGMPAMLPFPVMDSDGQPVLGKDGKPVYANLEPMMKYMEFQNKQKREDESHKTKLEIATGFKDLLGKAGTALSHMAEEEEKK